MNGQKVSYPLFIDAEVFMCLDNNENKKKKKKWGDHISTRSEWRVMK